VNRPVGIYYAYWAHEWDVDFLPLIGKAKSLGFDILELHAAILADKAPSYRLKVREQAEKAGIALSYGMGMDKDHDLSSTNEQLRQQGMAFMKEESKAPMLKQSLKSMAELAPFAQEHAVTLNVEVINRFEQFLINTCEEALAYVEEINSPACNILLDTFHMNIEEDSFGGAIRMAGNRLGSFHLGEPNRKPPGMGRMPWGEIKEALDAIGYTGPLVMEPFLTPGGSIGRAIGVWREIVKNPDLDALAEKSAAFVKANLR